MKNLLPNCCVPDAFRMLAEQLRSIHSSDSLIHGAVAIARHQLPNVDVAEVDAQLQKLADTVRSRVRGTQPQALVAHLHDVLFDEEGFTGNAEDFYNPANSYLPTVLQTKRGMPITLSLIYKIVAERVGLRSWGVGIPGHFIVAVEVDSTPMLIDPFNKGQLITPEEAHRRMKERFGAEIEWSDELLRPVSHRHWLTRMLQNLLSTFGTQGRYADVAAVLEMEMLMWPEQHRLQRDLALVLARIGMTAPATDWLNEYLANNPDDPQQADLRQLLDVLAA